MRHIATFGLLSLLSMQSLAAVTTDWANLGAGDWNTLGNWSAGVPTTSNTANVSNGGTAQLTVPPAGTALNLVLGNGVGQSGNLLVDSQALTAQGVQIGGSGTGNAIIRNGGSLSSTLFDVDLGSVAGSSGTVVVDGTGSALNSHVVMSIGGGGLGSLTIQNGASATSVQVLIASATTANTSSATVTNPGSFWNVSGNFIVGRGGSGFLTISDGGTVHSVSTVLGFFPGGAGSVMATGSNSVWNITSTFTLGNNAGSSGVLTIENRAHVTSTGTTRLGFLAGSTGTLNLNSSGILTLPQLQAVAGAHQANFNGGILQASTSNATFITGFAPGQLNILADGLFIDSQAFSIETNNNFSGVGTLTKQGSGIFTYSGTSSNTGGIAVDGGQFILNSTVAGAAVVNNSSVLQVNLGGVIQGPSTVNNTGNLIVNGSAASVATKDKGVLSGTGTVSSIDNSGIVAPGNSIGTLTVTGNYVNQATGTLQNELNAAGQTDLLIVGGTATIQGGTVDLIAAPGTYNAGTTYTLITAAGGLSGEFSTVLSNLPINYFLRYFPNSLVLTLGDAIKLQGLTGNGGRVANYINTFTTISGDFATVYDQLLTLNVKELSKALDQLHPAPFQALAITSVDSTHLVNDSFMDRLQFLRTTQCDPCDLPSGVWVAGLADFVKQDRSQGLKRFTATDGGIALGYDKSFYDNFIVGLGAGYSHNHISWSHSGGHSNGNLYYLGAYATKFGDHYYADASVLGMTGQYHSKRHIHFAKIDRHAKSKQHEIGVNPHLGAGWVFDLNRVDIIPFGEIDYYFVHQNKFHEQGARSLNLHVKHRNSNALRVETGLRIEKTYDCCGYSSFLPFGSISYVGHRYYDKKYKSSFNNQHKDFTVFGTDQFFNQAEFGVGFAYLFNDSFAINTSYEIAVGSKRQEQEFNFELSYRF